MEETVWSVAMELVSKVYELTGDKTLCDIYNSRLQKAYWPDEESEWVGYSNNGVWDLRCEKCFHPIPFGQHPEDMHYCPNCGAKMER